MLSDGAVRKSRGEYLFSHLHTDPASGSIGHNGQIWHTTELIDIVGDDSHAMH